MNDLGLISSLVAAGVRLSVPLGFAALGGTLSEKIGVYNIGLEGLIVAGAFGAAAGAAATSNPWLGLACGFACGLGIGAILATLTVTLAVDQIVAGIAVNLLAVGMTSFLARVFLGGEANTRAVKGLPEISIPFLRDLPILGSGLFRQNALGWLLIASTAFLHVFLGHTPYGLAIRAIGEAPRAADVAGLPVDRSRWIVVTIGGGIASLGGCYLVLAQVFVFSEHISAGKGFVALAAVILGRWTPVGAVACCLLFGGFEALQLQLQFNFPSLPYQLFATIPYLAAVVVLVSATRRLAVPAALGRPFVRGDR